jgi:hypothetical protein
MHVKHKLVGESVCVYKGQMQLGGFILLEAQTVQLLA